MSRLCMLSAVFVAILCVSGCQEPEFKRFICRDGNFAVEMPGMPEFVDSADVEKFFESFIVTVDP